jgi:hypothetical protein
MKRTFQLVAIAAITIGLAMTGCKKSNNTTGDDTTELKAQADDQSRVSNEMDASDNDANTAMNSSLALGGKTSTTATICDASIVLDTISDPHKATITYNGTVCAASPNRTRTGVIVVTIPANKKWKDQGAVLTVTFQWPKNYYECIWWFYIHPFWNINYNTCHCK